MPLKRKTFLTRLLICAMVLAIIPLLWLSISRRINAPQADPANVRQVAQGRQIYATSCASCHGSNLEGQPNWKDNLPTGGRPAPPHDSTGHTWYHPDELLFDIIKNGGQASSPTDYQNNMPEFGSKLSDTDIWSVLAYIKSQWPADIQSKQSNQRSK